MNTELTRFEQALDRWGSNFSDWPGPEAEWARRLTRTTEAARCAHEQARMLDEALGALPPVAASNVLKRRIVSAAASQRHHAARQRLWRPVLAATIPLLVGFWVGLNQGQDAAAATAEQVSLLAFTTNLEDLDYDP